MIAEAERIGDTVDGMLSAAERHREARYTVLRIALTLRETADALDAQADRLEAAERRRRERPFDRLAVQGALFEAPPVVDQLRRLAHEFDEAEREATAAHRGLFRLA